MDIYNKSQLEIALEFEREMKQEYNQILQNNGRMPVNEVNYSSSVNTPDYSAFGIAANTPGMSLADAQILEALLKGK